MRLVTCDHLKGSAAGHKVGTALAARPSMRTIGNEVDDGRLRRWSGQWRRSGLDGCPPWLLHFGAARFRVLRTSELLACKYAQTVGDHHSPGSVSTDGLTVSEAELVVMRSILPP